jgi:anthranilate phosphoribosyltransferase
MDIKAAIAQLMQAKDLSGESVIEVMRAIMSGAERRLFGCSAN